MCIYGQ